MCRAASVDKQPTPSGSVEQVCSSRIMHTSGQTVNFISLFTFLSSPGRYVTVPLSSLWSHCPKIKKLSGSLVNLRHLLMNEPAVKLSDDGRTVLVKYQEEGTLSSNVYEIQWFHSEEVDQAQQL